MVIIQSKSKGCVSIRDVRLLISAQAYPARLLNTARLLADLRYQRLLSCITHLICNNYFHFISV